MAFVIPKISSSSSTKGKGNGPTKATLSATSSPANTKRKIKGKNFTCADIHRMLDVMSSESLLRKNEWGCVAVDYNKGPPVEHHRDASALRNKFKRLKGYTKPTGDLDCPPEVRCAKQIQRLIEASEEVIDFDEDDITEMDSDINKNFRSDSDEGCDDCGNGNGAVGSSTSLYSVGSLVPAAVAIVDAAS
ncbi:hypothetical protein BJ742DRAFT_743197 [Cladochytrium replicatum]|nr:hypothetical protein BJ742DRAFT_743197 [Cladochytrium replicatum]